MSGSVLNLTVSGSHDECVQMKKALLAALQPFGKRAIVHIVTPDAADSAVSKRGKAPEFPAGKYVAAPAVPPAVVGGRPPIPLPPRMKAGRPAAKETRSFAAAVAAGKVMKLGKKTPANKPSGPAPQSFPPAHPAVSVPPADQGNRFTGTIRKYNSVRKYYFVDCKPLFEKYGCDIVVLPEDMPKGVTEGATVSFAAFEEEGRRNPLGKEVYVM